MTYAPFLGGPHERTRQSQDKHSPPTTQVRVASRHAALSKYPDTTAISETHWTRTSTPKAIKSLSRLLRADRLWRSRARR